MARRRSPADGARRKTVYDAAAGRIVAHVREPSATSRSDKAMLLARTSVLTPEEALYRNAGAPDRFEETDTYFAHEALPGGGGGGGGGAVLPDSDLLKAVHHYASHYYEALARADEEGKGPGPAGGPPARLLDERSLDETALLAFGILLEEAGRALLGAGGDLVFTEADEEYDDADDADDTDNTGDTDDTDDDGSEAGESEPRSGRLSSLATDDTDDSLPL